MKALSEETHRGAHCDTQIIISKEPDAIKSLLIVICIIILCWPDIIIAIIVIISTMEYIMKAIQQVKGCLASP